MKTAPKPSRFFLKTLSAAAILGMWVATPAQGVVIEFSSGEGYSNGTLHLQPSGTPVWTVSSEASTPFTVNTAGAGTVALNVTLNSRIAGYVTPVDFTNGLSYVSTLDFSFEQATPTVPGTTTAAGLIYSADLAATSINALSAGFGRGTATDGYRLAGFGASSSNIAGLLLGINSGAGTPDTTSDPLRLTYTLRQGGSSSTWVGTATLTNLTTSVVAGTITSSAINIGANDPASFFNAIQIGASMSTSGLSAFTVQAYSSPTAIPEPASTALILGCGGLALLRRRRR